MATAGHLAAQGLAQTEAAQAARRLRSKKTRRSLQRGGVTYAREARHMAQEREEDDVHKAQAALNRAKAKEHRKEKLEWQPIVRLAKGRLAQEKKQRAQRERQMKAICRQIHRKVAIVF
ncbi:MAG: hypothetical protein M1823_000313 [Watsoniomyces obsoletus]|nr:MAG: hypothetical protein M1823_000313 [Watsoniomyces obsoletus]